MISKLIPKLIETATKSDSQMRLSSCILTNTTKPQALSCNSERSLIRGINCCSFHSEISSIMKYYGRTFQRYHKNWYIL